MSDAYRSFTLEPEAAELLLQHNIPYPQHGLAHTPEEAAQIAGVLAFPVVLKIVSRDTLHKSDVGGVMTDLDSADEVRWGFEKITRSVEAIVPGTQIEGVLVCQQAPPGIEVIVGGLDDAIFGPTVMFGMGGVFAEVLRDVTFRIVPLERRDAVEMIQEIRGYPLITGTRGKQPCDMNALEELLLNVSQLMLNQPDIEQLDLNPVRLYPSGLLALDVRVLRKPRVR